MTAHNTLGLTKIQAVNRMLAAVQTNRVTALDSTGSWPSLTYGPSEEATAEYWLDVVSQRIQSQSLNRGLTFNVVFAKKYTAGTVDGVLSVQFASTVIGIRPAGSNQFDRFELRQDMAYDLKNDTLTLAAGDYFFDVVSVIDFANCPPDVKELIIAEATVEYQRRRKGNPQVDVALNEERTIADTSTGRSKAAVSAITRGPGAIMTGPSAAQGQPG